MTRHDLQPGVVRLSKEEQNIADTTAFTHSLTTLLGARRCTPVALSLPDQCAHVALFPFDEFPKDPTERESMVAWKLEQEFRTPSSGSRIAYRVFHHPAGRKTPCSSKFHVLAAAIRHQVINQYEQICAEAGLLPVSIGIQGLQLFELCRPMMHDAEDFFFASLLDGQLFFLAIREGCPVMLRSKPLPPVQAAGHHELAATIEYYDEVCASTGVRPRLSGRSLYLLQDEAESTKSESSTPLTQHDRDALRITICPVSKHSLPVAWPASEMPWISSLPALASLTTQ